MTLKSHLKTFSKSQVTAALATLVDFGSLLLLVEVFKVYYVIATALAAVLGAMTNYGANRIWAFKKETHDPIPKEILRYAAVSIGSLSLNTLGVYLVTEHIHTPYFISKLIIALAVGLFWNYPLHKYFVFKEVTAP